MSWTIEIPHRSRDESLVDTAANVRHLPADDRGVMREIVLGARLDGLRTAGELLDHVAGLEPHERRAMLDRARADCGLASTSEVDARRRAEGPHFVHIDHRPTTLHVSEGGAIVERYADEEEIAALDERRRAAEREARESNRASDVAAHAEHERARREQLDRELPPHLRRLPA